MQTATSTYLAAAAVSSPAARPLRATANTLVAVADTGLMLRRVQQALVQAGVTPDAIELVWGRAGLAQLAVPQRRRGVLGVPGRWLAALGPDAELLERYRHEVTHGRALIVVRGVPRAVAEAMRDHMVAAGGRCLQHYGRFSVAYLAV